LMSIQKGQPLIQAVFGVHQILQWRFDLA